MFKSAKRIHHSHVKLSNDPLTSIQIITPAGRAAEDLICLGQRAQAGAPMQRLRSRGNAGAEIHGGEIRCSENTWFF